MALTDKKVIARLPHSLWVTLCEAGFSVDYLGEAFGPATPPSMVPEVPWAPPPPPPPPPPIRIPAAVPQAIGRPRRLRGPPEWDKDTVVLFCLPEPKTNMGSEDKPIKVFRLCRDFLSTGAAKKGELQAAIVKETGFTKSVVAAAVRNMFKDGTLVFDPQSIRSARRRRV